MGHELLSIPEFLSEIRAHLGPLPPAEVDDIVRELASHLTEKAVSGGAALAVAAIGDPEELARLYLIHEPEESFQAPFAAAAARSISRQPATRRVGRRQWTS